MEAQQALTDDEIRAQFWRTVENRAMALPYCRGCSKYFFFPRPFCPACWSDQIELRPASGRGKVWSYSVVRFAHGAASPWHQRLPYALALVDLEEGVRIMANVLECPVEQVRSGMPVQLTYADLDGRTLYAFKPA
jgi:uncharacterized OB-fold protein